MNLIKPLLLIAAIVSLTASTGCRKTALGCGTANYNYVTELQDEANELAAAAQAYGQDQSQANCNAYIKALNDYLDAADDIDNCVPAADRSAYNQAIDDARASVNQIQC